MVSKSHSTKHPFPGTKEERRLILVALFVLFLFSLLIIQFFRIQIIQHERWEKEAYAQHTVVVKEPFKRGVFYSNAEIKSAHPIASQALVIDVPKFHIYIDPKSIPENARGEIEEKLSAFLQLSLEEKIHLKEQFIKPSRSRRIALWIGTDVKDRIQEWWLSFARKRKIARNALYFTKDYHRSYPFGKLLGHVLHTVRDLRDETTNQNIPTGGLEYVLDEYLQGKPGKRLFYRSPHHTMDMGQLIEAPEDGADIYLTINHHLQTIAEEEIEKQVKKAEAKRGWALMMDPHTGEVLALAQYPFFDPKECKNYFNDPEKLEETQVKAITDPFEPGSTMKPITMAVCLMANEELKKQGKKPLFDPGEKVNTLACLFPGRNKVLKDVRRNHHYLNMYMAMQKSSNVYMAKIVDRVIQELGEMWYRSILQNVFGFGQKTGIELPAESAGLLPMPGKMHPNGTLEWSRPTPYSLAIGHNILANSFQMMRSFAIIANGGYDVKPTLIKKIVKKNPDGSEKVLMDHKDILMQSRQHRLLSKPIIDELIHAMKYVTKPGGMAAKGDIYGYTEVGKTATSEKVINGVYSKKDHISTFLGFAPADHPRFVLMIVIDEPVFKYIPGVGNNQYGGSCASPAFKAIGLKTLEYLGVAPDDPFGYPVGDPRRDPKKSYWSAEVEALNKLYEQWNR